MPTTVRDVMTSEVVTARVDQTVEQAADVLAQHGIGAMPVVDDDGALVGLLRDEDLIVSEARLHVPTVISFLGADIVLPSALHRFEDQLRRAVGATVGDVMEKDCATVRPDASLEDLATLMHDRDVTHVPVVDAGRLVGIVARGDLVRHLAAST
ncbi:MAG TPA: CBS domain-containing protein [Acidimicrobiia bacterium]|nr:CBS domain-containing protein [Acidimicrobiia bacterium]